MATIVIATDLSDASRSAFEAGIDLAKDLGTDIVLVHALPPASPYVTIAGGAVPRDVQQAREEIAMDDALAMSDEWLADARAQGLEIRGVMDPAIPRDLVMATAQETQASMIVVGSHGRTGITRALVGSIAEDILRHSEVPVLVVPAAKPS